jgi:hypothetical protein
MACLLVSLGFYYVCVDFNPPAVTPSSARVTAQQLPLASEGEDMDMTSFHSLKQDTARRACHDSGFRRAGARAPSQSPRPHAPAATMSGFYYHQNSEP